MIITPDTHPDHHTVGRYFMGLGTINYCDSYDQKLGYWLTPVYIGETAWDHAKKRRNVSERAIGGTYRQITVHRFPDGRLFVSCQFPPKVAEREFIMELYNNGAIEHEQLS